jgi:competence ComEA-like helix-hairpin-helix protein
LSGPDERTRAHALLAVSVGLVLLGGARALSRTVNVSPLPCAFESLRPVGEGDALHYVCAETGGQDGLDGHVASSKVSAAAARVLGRRWNLNEATAEEIAQVPGIGRARARALVAARASSGGFQSWDQVDAVPGIGPVLLRALQSEAELAPSGARSSP